MRRAPRRSQAFTPRCIEDDAGKLKLKDLTRERLIQVGKDRAKEGMGPVTISMDIVYIKRVVSHAAAVHGTLVQAAPIAQELCLGSCTRQNLAPSRKSTA